MSDSKFKENLFKYGGIDASKGTLYLRGNARMLGNGSYMSQLTVKDMVVTGNAVIPGISFDSLTVAGNVVSTDGNFVGNGALMTGVISTPPPEANIDIVGNVDGTYVYVNDITAISGNIGNVRMVGGNVSASGQVNIRGNVVARGFIGNGSRLVNVKISGVQTTDIVGNVQGEYVNVGVITATFGTVGGVLMADGNVSVSGQVDVLGNVTADYFIGNGVYIVGTLPITANVDIKGNVIGTNANVSNVKATTGNIGNVRFAGGNMSTSGQVIALGNIVANKFIGNGAFLTGITHPPISNMDIYGNVIGTYVNVGTVNASAGNIGNVVCAGGNVSASGQVDVRGNVAAGYFIGNGALVTNSKGSGNQTVDIRGNATGEYANVDDITAIFGNIGNVRMSGGNVSVSGQVNVRGNVTAGYFVGNGSEVFDAIPPPIAVIDIRGNTTGAYSNVGKIIAIFGNIGNVTLENGTMRVSGDMTVIGNVATGSIIGNGTTLDALNVSGNASIGENMVVLGSVAAGYFIGNGALLRDVVATRIPSEANVDIRGNANGTYANVGEITALSGNIGNVGFANGSVHVSGNIHVAGNVSAENFIGNTAFLSGIYVQPNVDIRGNANGAYANVGTIQGISGNTGNVRMAGGNVSASGNINVAGTMTANCFIGDGSLVLIPRKRPARYVSVYLTQNQTISSGTWGNRYIIMDAIREGRGITYDTSSGEFTLEAGITYRITAQLTWEASNSVYFYPFRVYSTALNQQIGIPSEALPIGSASLNTSSSALDMIYTPPSEMKCRLRMGSETGSASSGEELRADLGTFLNIEEINDVFFIDLPPFANATVRGNLVGNYANVGNITALVGNIGNVKLENGNIALPGQVDVRGNVTANCFVGNGSQLKNIVLTGNHVIDIRGNVDGNYVNVGAVQATIGNIGNVRMENGNMHVRGQVNVLGNVAAGYFIGNGALLTNVILSGIQIVDIIGNVDGTYVNVSNANASILGSIGKVLMENGNITTVGHMTAVGNITANCFLGDGAQLTDMIASSELQTVDIRGNVKGGNVNVVTITAITGNIGNVKMEGGNIVAAYFANIGNTRMLRSGTGPDTFNVSGQVNVLDRVTANYFIGDGARVSNIQVSGTRAFDIRGNVTGNYIDVYNVNVTRYGNIGNVQMEQRSITASYANIGNVRMEAGNMRVSGQVNVLGNVTAGQFIGNGALLTNVILRGNQALDISGNVQGNYIIVGNVVATMFGNIGNVRFSRGNVTANIGNIGNVRMEAGNISATAANIGGVVVTQGSLDIRGQVNVRGNVSAGYFIGDGSEVSGVTTPYPTPIPPSITIDIIEGNLIGNNVNVHIARATIGNVGNNVMAGGNLSVSGQVNVRGNVVAQTCIGNIISNFGNIGNTVLAGGNVSISGQVNVLGDIVANAFIGDGLGLYSVGMPIAWLSLGRLTSKSISSGTWKDIVLSTDMNTLAQNPGAGIGYNRITGEITLVAGVSYRITAQMSFESTRTDETFTNNLISFGLWSKSFNRISGGAIARPLLLNTGPANAASCPILDVIITAETPALTTVCLYEVRCTAAATAGSTEILRAVGTFINIVSLVNGPTPI
jgi:hypothetical protein